MQVDEYANRCFVNSRHVRIDMWSNMQVLNIRFRLRCLWAAAETRSGRVYQFKNFARHVIEENTPMCKAVVHRVMLLIYKQVK